MPDKAHSSDSSMQQDEAENYAVDQRNHCVMNPFFNALDFPKKSEDSAVEADHESEDSAVDAVDFQPGALLHLVFVSRDLEAVFVTLARLKAHQVDEAVPFKQLDEHHVAKHDSLDHDDCSFKVVPHFLIDLPELVYQINLQNEQAQEVHARVERQQS